MYTKLSRKTSVSENIYEEIGNIHENLISIKSEMEYKQHLTALLNKFTQAELASLIGITERSIQNYVSESYPTVPHQKNIRKIREVYENEILGKPAESKQSEESYQTKRLKQKTESKAFMVPFIPVKAQAGYVKAIDQEIFLDALEKYALPPGVSGHGAIWRYWEVEGDSMEPTFKEGDIVLTSFVHPMDWDNMRNFYTYVIVTQDRILIKRVYHKNALEWVLISDNEELYEQQLLPVEFIKEVWVYRKTWSTRAAPPKEFKITV